MFSPNESDVQNANCLLEGARSLRTLLSTRTKIEFRRREFQNAITRTGEGQCESAIFSLFYSCW